MRVKGGSLSINLEFFLTPHPFSPSWEDTMLAEVASWRTMNKRVSSRPPTELSASRRALVVARCTLGTQQDDTGHGNVDRWRPNQRKIVSFFAEFPFICSMHAANVK